MPRTSSSLRVSPRVVPLRSCRPPRRRVWLLRGIRPRPGPPSLEHGGPVPDRYDPGRHRERGRARGRLPGRGGLRRRPAQHLLLHRQRHLSAVGIHPADVHPQGRLLRRPSLLRRRHAPGRRHPGPGDGRERCQQRRHHQHDVRPHRLLAVRVLQHPHAQPGLQRHGEPDELHRRLRHRLQGRPHRDRRRQRPHRSTPSSSRSSVTARAGGTRTTGSTSPTGRTSRSATASSAATPLAAYRCTRRAASTAR